MYLAGGTRELELGFPHNTDGNLRGVLAFHVVGRERAHGGREEEHLVVRNGVDLVRERNPVCNSDSDD